MRAMTMGFEEAAVAIGEALAELPTVDIIENKIFPAPNIFEDIVLNPGYITSVVRWDGIALDGDELPVPNSFRYEIRILSDLFGIIDADLNPDELSGYLLAQRNVLRASASLYENLALDRSLGGLVLGTTIISSFTGDLIDTVTNTTFYGHEIVLDVVMSVE